MRVLRVFVFLIASLVQLRQILFSPADEGAILGSAG